MKFGTDGIRGVYGETLTENTAYRLGAALGKSGTVLIGRDNRPSSPSLARAVACGVASAGGSANAVGLVTTPALFYLTKALHAHYGVMITASHNPPSHNGLKVFTPDGKPSEPLRLQIEEAMAKVTGEADPAFPLSEDARPLSLYRNFFRACIGNLEGLTAVVDFAGGAGYAFKNLLTSLGAKVFPLNLREKGDRINLNCGALHPFFLAEETRRLHADLGFALDGDGDRIVAADEKGSLWDGDRILYYFACKMKEKGMLRKNEVALTVMSNSGVLKSLSEQGIRALSCAVGDSAVAETMKGEGLNLGGEQSGHVILGDSLMTGDALLVGAALLKSIREEGPLGSAPRPMVYPQVLLNLPVKEKGIAASPAIQALAAEVKESLGEGRVLLRASGTENMIRIMVEHPDRSRALLAAEKLQKALAEQ